MPESKPLADFPFIAPIPASIKLHLDVTASSASARNVSIYLVGGVVRDLILGRSVVDLDLVVEGSAIDFAHRTFAGSDASITNHRRFGTTTVAFQDGFRFDFATARSEEYPVPGALPRVTPSDLEGDLARRDFTINALAFGISGARAGELIDYHSGQSDLDLGVIRVLHGGSFSDDPTRLVRAIRFEQRLGFHLEPGTLEGFQESVSEAALGTLTGTRLVEQVRLALEEEDPWSVVVRLDQLEILPLIFPECVVDKDLCNQFASIRAWSCEPGSDRSVRWCLYLLSLVSCSGSKAISLPVGRHLEDCVDSLRAMDEVAESVANGTIVIKSDFYRAAIGIPATVILWKAVADPRENVREFCEAYYSRDRHVRTHIDGNTLKAAGIPEGPVFSRIMERILMARLDGMVDTEIDETAMVRKIWDEERSR